MNKILVVAGREYSAAVKTKSFLISLVLLPVMMGAGVLMQGLTQKIGDTSTKRIAVIDRTPGQQLIAPLLEAAERRNANDIFETGTRRQVKPHFVFEPVPPAAEDQAARQRFDLSEQVRNGELFAIVEIGQDVLKPQIKPTTQSVAAAQEARSADPDRQMELAEQALGESNLIRYRSNRPTYLDVQSFLRGALAPVIQQRKLQEAGLPIDRVMPLITPPHVAAGGLVIRDEAGNLTDESRAGTIASFILPVGLLMLMFVIIIVGASPLTTNVIEEKQQRIAEVLLGSVRPFELMAGKLLGGVGVAMTLAAIYLAGALWVAAKYDALRYASPALLAWFALFCVVGTLMYGSMFVAAGAAVTNVKEAQSLITPVTLFIVLPLVTLGPMLQNPSGPLPTAMTFFPLSAPMVTVARLAIPPGIPVWQALAGAAVSVLTTAFLIWCAGRIFRVGILMQGQGAKLADLIRWAVRG